MMLHASGLSITEPARVVGACPRGAEMSEKLYTGHNAVEVLELMGMLAAQYDIHSADEALSIARKGRNLLADQQDRIKELESRLDAALLKLAEETKRADTGWQLAHEMKADRDACAALLRRFVSFAVEMPADLGTCLAMGNKIVADAKALLKEPNLRYEFDAAQAHNLLRDYFDLAVVAEGRCPMCYGNDADMPCAYPGEDQPGCLRDKRLSAPSAPSEGEKP